MTIEEKLEKLLSEKEFLNNPKDFLKALDRYSLKIVHHVSEHDVKLKWITPKTNEFEKL